MYLASVAASSPQLPSEHHHLRRGFFESLGLAVQCFFELIPVRRQVEDIALQPSHLPQVGGPLRRLLRGLLLLLLLLPRL